MGAIDAMPRELHALRSRLVGEIRESDDIGRPGRRDALSVQARVRLVADVSTALWTAALYRECRCPAWY
jgi:hypothetical protein